MSQYQIDSNFQQALQDRLSGLDIYAYSVIDSTNTEAKRMSAEGKTQVALIAAVRQTQGRGRMGRSFYSPADTGAYFSILYTPTSPLQNAVRITSAASVALMRAIRNLSGIQTEIKWVNDLYLKGKKIAGILCESVTGGTGVQIILGIGVNLSTADFPEELADIAGALGRNIIPADLIAATCRELQPYIEDAADLSWLGDYRTHSTVLGRGVTWIDQGGTHTGVAREIDGEGALIVCDAEGTEHRLQTGEITLRLS